MASRLDSLVATACFSLRRDLFGVPCPTISSGGLVERGKQIRPPRAIPTRRNEDRIPPVRPQAALVLIPVFIQVTECFCFQRTGRRPTPNRGQCAGNRRSTIHASIVISEKSEKNPSSRPNLVLRQPETKVVEADPECEAGIRIRSECGVNTF